jgi:ABC-type multidrug transport system permease subunit
MNLKEIFKGDSKNYLENLSYRIILVSAVLIFIGFLLGSFVKYAIFLAMLGGFFVIVGIVIWIIVKLREE